MNKEDFTTLFHRDGEPISWKDLEEILSKMTEDEKLSSISIYDPDADEFYSVLSLKRTTVTDVLDEGELFLQFNLF